MLKELQITELKDTNWTQINMLNYEQFRFFCHCGEELRTDPDNKVTCSKCKRSYEVEAMKQKYLFPKEKDATINKR